MTHISDTLGYAADSFAEEEPGHDANALPFFSESCSTGYLQMPFLKKPIVRVDVMFAAVALAGLFCPRLAKAQYRKTPAFYHEYRILSAAPQAQVYVRNECGNLFLYDSRAREPKRYQPGIDDAVVSPDGENLVGHLQAGDIIAHRKIGQRGNQRGRWTEDAIDSKGMDLLAVSDTVGGRILLLVRSPKAREEYLYDIGHSKPELIKKWNVDDTQGPVYATFVPGMARFIGQTPSGLFDWDIPQNGTGGSSGTEAIKPKAVSYGTLEPGLAIAAVQDDVKHAWLIKSVNQPDAVFPPAQIAWKQAGPLTAGPDAATTTAVVQAGTGEPARVEGNLDKWQWLPVRLPEVPPTHILTFATSPDQQWIVITSRESKKRAVLWRINNAIPVPVATLEGVTDNCFAIAFSPDSQFVALGDIKGAITVYQIESGNLNKSKHVLKPFGKLAPGLDTRITSLSWNPQNQAILAVGRLDGQVQIMAFSQGGTAKSPLKYQATALQNAAGKTMTLKEIRKFTTIIVQVKFSDDGKFLLASGRKSSDKSHGGMLLWEAKQQDSGDSVFGLKTTVAIPEPADTGALIHRDSQDLPSIIYGTFVQKANAASNTSGATTSQFAEWAPSSNPHPFVRAEIRESNIVQLLILEGRAFVAAGNHVYLMPPSSPDQKIASVKPLLTTKSPIFSLGGVPGLLLVGCDDDKPSLYCFRPTAKQNDAK